ncbi:unnamed protein product [Chrysodeixis includens]|uniref:Peptidase S1 domain-containing protein n=1 Tax=Chrysodeixis includens TaxID=689277 RepID=A0A9P0BX01_CHRIL|nr:unnamed protein product [Chrysodeixis includens]
MLVFILMCGFSAVYVNCQVITGSSPGVPVEIGQNCYNFVVNEPGKCIPYKDCEMAKIDEKFNVKPELCLVNKTTKYNLVCCLNKTMHDRVEGYVSYAVLGILFRNQKLKQENIYGIKNIIKYPLYKPPKKYHDIALLEMDRRVTFDIGVIPACLHVGDEDTNQAYATGWGYLGKAKDLATVLQKIPLWPVSNETCLSKFSPYKRHLPDGIDEASQMCYGDDGKPRDTCEGDSGGPLQIMSKKVYCTFTILGVTSFGITACGEIGFPGVYTRVSNYIPWIEGIVWPKEQDQFLSSNIYFQN